jgi:hypothetical protein
MFIFFQPDFCEPETCDEPGSWEEKLAEEFRNEQEDFSVLNTRICSFMLEICN